jgi:hypothetical protein
MLPNALSLWYNGAMNDTGDTMEQVEQVDIVRPEDILKPIWNEVIGREGLRHLIRKRFRRYSNRVKLAEQKGRPETMAFFLRHRDSDYLGLMIAYDEIEKFIILSDLVREKATRFDIADPKLFENLEIAVKEWVKSTTDGNLTKAAADFPDCKAPILWEGATFYIDS